MHASSIYLHYSIGSCRPCVHKKNTHFCQRNIRVDAYCTYVRPILEYTAFVWSPYTNININKLESVQTRAARYVMSDFNRYNTNLWTMNLITNISMPRKLRPRLIAANIHFAWIWCNHNSVNQYKLCTLHFIATWPFLHFQLHLHMPLSLSRRVHFPIFFYQQVRLYGTFLIKKIRLTNLLKWNLLLPAPSTLNPTNDYHSLWLRDTVATMTIVYHALTPF